MLKSIRCSSLPLAFLCPGSVHGEGPLVDMTNDASDDGTAVHAGIESVVRGMYPEAAHELMLAEHPSCNRGEVTPLFWAGVKMWREISKWMPNAVDELALQEGHLSGHMDIATQMDANGVVLDWKSGRKDHDYHHQGFGYAWLAMQDTGELTSATVHFAWLRTQELESYTVSRERAEAWYVELTAKVINWDGKYHAGKHCTFCPRRTSCPAVTALVRQDVAMFADGRTFELSTCTGPELCDHFRKIKMLQHLLDAAERNARMEIGHRGEVLDGAGSVIHYVPTKGNREINPLRAWPVLTDRFTDDEIATVVDIGVGKLEDAAKAKAIKTLGKGKGAAAVRELNEALEKADALSREPGQRLVDERTK